MGQRSSQITANDESPPRTVVPSMADDSEERPSTASAASQITNGSQLNLSTQGMNLTPNNAALSSKKKRKAEKPGDLTSPSKRSKLRPMPQSRRGTNIQPDESVQPYTNSPKISTGADSGIDISQGRDERNETVIASPKETNTRQHENDELDENATGKGKKGSKIRQNTAAHRKKRSSAAANGMQDDHTPVSAKRKRDKQTAVYGSPADTQNVHKRPIGNGQNSTKWTPKPINSPMAPMGWTTVKWNSINKPSQPSQSKRPETPRAVHSASSSRPKFSSQPRQTGADTSTIDPPPTRSPQATPKRVSGTPQRRTRIRNGFADGGIWSDAEKARADDIFNQTCRDLGLTEDELKRQINESWGKLTEFKTRMFEAFSQRKRKSVYKFCVRRFHNFDTGPWSAEDDERLMDAYIKHPDSWADIAEYVGRSSQACRDRHRNHLKYKGLLELGPWTEAEEELLLHHVEEALNLIRKSHPRDTDQAALEEQINWEQISKAMDGTRSRKRCMEKYRRLQAKPSVDDAHPTNDATDKSQAILDQLGSGDQIDALQELVTAFAGEEEKVEHRKDIWPFVAQKCPDSRFTPRERRRIYKATLEHWKDDADVQRGDGIVEKAQLLVEKLFESQDGEPLERKFRLAVTQTPGKKKSQSTPSKPRKRIVKRVFKSAENIDEDDINNDDDDDDDE